MRAIQGESKLSCRSKVRVSVKKRNYTFDDATQLHARRLAGYNRGRKVPARLSLKVNTYWNKV